MVKKMTHRVFWEFKKVRQNIWSWSPESDMSEVRSGLYELYDLDALTSWV